MTNVNSIIAQLQQKRESIDRAIDALRQITAAAPVPAAATRKKRTSKQVTSTATGNAPNKRGLTQEQKQAISSAWTPERKQKFAEFHVQRMARARGEDPAKALREYRRRKQKEQAATAATRKAGAPAKPNRTGRKTAAKAATAAAGS